MLLANDNVEDTQGVSVVAEAAPSNPALCPQSTNDQFLIAVIYQSYIRVVQLSSNNVTLPLQLRANQRTPTLLKEIIAMVTVTVRQELFCLPNVILSSKWNTHAVIVATTDVGQKSTIAMGLSRPISSPSPKLMRSTKSRKIPIRATK